MLSEKECLNELEKSKLLTVLINSGSSQVGFYINFEQTTIFDTFKQLIEEHFKEDNTAGFKHFKLYSDNTLKNMNKDGLISYVHILYNNWARCDETLQNLINYAKKLSDSNDELRKQLYFCEPYRFEDLYEGMWVWDDKIKWIYRIKRVNSRYSIEVNDEDFSLVFKENRFYPVTKVFNNQ